MLDLTLKKHHIPKLKEKYGDDNTAIIAAEFWWQHIPGIRLKEVIQSAKYCNEEIDSEESI